MFRMMQNRDVLDVDVELDVDEELDIHVDLDVDVEDGAVFGVLSHRPLRLQHDILPAVCYFAFMCSMLDPSICQVGHERKTSSKM